jgi:hypothetical protein
MQLCDLENIDELSLATDPEERAHQQMLLALKNPSLLIDNIDTDLKAMNIDGAILPVSISNECYDQSYMNSMYTTFVSHARREVRHLDNKYLQKFLLGIVSCLSKILKGGKIDRIVAHNNFFFATNLYPSVDWQKDRLENYLKSLSRQYGQHAIIFRSLNRHTNGPLIDALVAAGCWLMPMRQIYVFDRSLKDFTKERHYRVDLNLLKNNREFLLCDNSAIRENDYARISLLYKKLYIDKHSPYNPMLNRNYIEHSHRCGFIDYSGLRNCSGVLEGIVGSYDRHNVSTTPIVGYNTELSQELGLYRMLMAHGIDKADKKGFITNMSGGAKQFKMRRGAVPFIEYSAVYTRHLRNPIQRVVWKALGTLLTHVGIPVMKKY